MSNLFLLTENFSSPIAFLSFLIPADTGSGAQVAFPNALPPLVMVYSLLLGAISFVFTLLIGKPTILMLRKRGIGKKIRIEEPDSNMVKMGTPTMGGIMIFATIFVISALFFGLAFIVDEKVFINYTTYFRARSILLPLGVVISCGILGAIDDFLNLVGKKGKGLTARFKFFWLFVIASVAGLILRESLQLHNIFIPIEGSVYLTGFIYVPLAVIAIVGSSNAVNLTDGLDTLAPGTVAIAFAAYGIIAYVQRQPQIVALCFIVVGSVLAFLWYNAHPAQVFMGDTGSLSLGALLAVVAFLTDQWFILPIVGVVFVAEALSVIIQVGYFKATKGKRIFRMSPLHFHFELGGWAETQVTMRFWLIGFIGAMLGIALALAKG